MKSFKIRFLTFFLLVWAHLAFQSAVAGEGLKVLVSIKPVHSIVSALMEGTDGAQLLVPKGKTPFTHRVSDQQRAAIAAADLLIWVGPELESSIAAEVKKAEGKSRVITLLDHPDLKILPHRVDENRRDPYFWMDTRNALILINDFANVLIEMDATRAHLYKRNRSKLIKEISLLDRKLEFGYRGLKGGVGLNYYDTLQYFEQAYALKIGGVLTTSPNDLVKGADLLLMHNKIKRGEYACLFTEMGLPRDNLSLLSEGSEVNIAELDTFGTQFEPGPELYTQLMDYNTTTLKECMAKAHQGEDDGLPELPVEEEISRLEPIEGKFMLIDHLGKLVTDEDLKGKYQLLLLVIPIAPISARPACRRCRRHWISWVTRLIWSNPISSPWTRNAIMRL